MSSFMSSDSERREGEKEKVETTTTMIKCDMYGDLVLTTYPDQKKLVEAKLSASVERKKEKETKPAKRAGIQGVNMLLKKV